MYITEQELRNKILGCWFGKNVGGTLGAPYEWRRQINNVTFYQDSVNGEPLPNDDLDIQLPTQDGKPDYDVMATLISAVQKMVIKDVVRLADSRIEKTKELTGNDE